MGCLTLTISRGCSQRVVTICLQRSDKDFIVDVFGDAGSRVFNLVRDRIELTMLCCEYSIRDENGGKKNVLQRTRERGGEMLM